MNNLPNANCSYLFCKPDVKTGNMYASYRGVFTCTPLLITTEFSLFLFLLFRNFCTENNALLPTSAMGKRLQKLV